MEIPEISSITTGNETVNNRQKAPKTLTELFDFANNKETTIGGIVIKYGLEGIKLNEKTKSIEDDGR